MKRFFIVFCLLTAILAPQLAQAATTILPPAKDYFHVGKKPPPQADTEIYATAFDRKCSPRKSGSSYLALAMLVSCKVRAGWLASFGAASMLC